MHDVAMELCPLGAAQRLSESAAASAAAAVSAATAAMLGNTKRVQHGRNANKKARAAR